MKKLLLVIMALLTLSLVAATPVSNWDKSSLVFNISSSNCNDFSANFCNAGSNMAGSTSYEVYFSATGNPKDGAVVGTGSISALDAGECVDLSYDPGTVYGNYMFKVYQRPDHPGQGVLWSDSISFSECTVPEFSAVGAFVGLALVAGMFVLMRKR